MRKRSKRRAPLSVLLQRLKFNFDIRYLFMGVGAIAAVALIVLLIVFIPTRHEAQQGKMSFSVATEGIVVRSEKLYQMDVNGKAELTVEEGQSVAKGEEIAMVYSSDYSESALNDLKNIQAKILDYLRNNLMKNILNQDLSNLDAQIAELTEKIHQMIADNKTGDLLKYERELRNLMEQRQTFLREQVNVDSQLQSYYEEEAALLAGIEGWRRSSTAESDGVVSFYFDGAESVLTPANMMKLTVTDISNILDGKSYYTLTDSTTSRPLYRLVEKNNWYVVVISESRIPEFESKDTAFQVKFGGADSDTYTAKAMEVREEGKNFIYYFHFTDDISKLIIARNVDMTISMDYVGIMVPEKAIRTRNGEKGVYIRNEDKDKQFIPVEILINNDGYAIIQAVDLEDPLNENSTLLY